MSTTIDRPDHAGPTELPASNPLEAFVYILLRAPKAIASLQLTVVLFAFAILLVFFGTLAQMDFGIWTVVDKYFWSWYVMVPTDLLHKFGQVFLAEQYPKETPPWGGAFPLPAGKLIGLAMLLNLLAAHALRFKLTWKRSGIFLIHSGMILLFVGEFITREYAIEQRMTIVEGSSVNFGEDSRLYELAVVDKSDPKEDSVTVIPGSILKKATGRIANPDLPFDLEVVEYMTNSKLAAPTKDNPATAGIGKREMAVRQPEVSGVDTKQSDHPAAYLKLFKKGTDEPLGTYLVSLMHYRIGRHESLTIDGKTYDITLRFKRYYKDYRIHLIDFKFDRYPGTQKPKNFSSDVKVLDRNGNVERELTIRMNDPLRHEGETFYQSSFENEGEAVESTVLQVVKNPGWMIPYTSCVMVALGLLIHFLIKLIVFLKKNRIVPTFAVAATAPKAELESDVAPRGGWWVRNLPSLTVAVIVLYLLSVYGRMAPEKQPYNLDAFSRILVLEGGRVKPLDSVARVYLRSISGQSVFKDEKGDEQPAIRWYLDTLGAKPSDEKDPAWAHKVFRIDNEQLLSELKLAPREGLRYSLKEIRVTDLDKKVKAVLDKKRAGGKLDLRDTKLLELAEKIELVLHIASGRGHDTDRNQFHLVPPLREGEKWVSLGDYRSTAINASLAQVLAVTRTRVLEKPGGFTDDDARRLLGKDGERATAQQLAEFRKTLFTMSPEMVREEARSEMYRDLIGYLLEALPQQEQDEIRVQMAADLKARLAANPGVAMWDRMSEAYHQRKPEEFNRLVEEYRSEHLGQVAAGDRQRASVEIAYNRFAPFLRCIGLYVIALVLAVLGFVFKAAELPRLGDSFRRSAMLLLALTFIVHVGGLLTRMYVSDRWFVFVTNLYSSAIFIGVGCVALGLILELIYPIGIGNAVAAVLGVATTIVAHNLATEDTLEMMEAVLDTNFWLATHVTTVTLGYTATFVAGFLGMAYVLLMLAAVVRDSFRSKVQPAADALLSFGTAVVGIVMIPLLIGLVLFETLKSFEVVPSYVGTVLELVMVVGAVLYGLAHLMARAAGTQENFAAGATPKFATPIVGMGLTPALSKILGQMIYGVICFATLLSFTGTVLGGIWADQSWGRFWGWDPKENGAVLIVLWNALILHARWCGLVKVRGMAVLTIFGNVVTAWSWFGTNQLGIGLHAYGFDTRLADGCFNFWLGMFFVAAVGMIPQRFWSASASPVAVISVAPPHANEKGKRRRRQ